MINDLYDRPQGDRNLVPRPLYVFVLKLVLCFET